MQECVSLAADQCDETIAFVAPEPLDDAFPRNAASPRTFGRRILLPSLAVAVGGKSIAADSERRFELAIPVHRGLPVLSPSAPKQPERYAARSRGLKMY